jgi:hypothetical protein
MLLKDPQSSVHRDPRRGFFRINGGFLSHGGTPSWMVDFMENPNLIAGWWTYKIYNIGVPLFQETSKYFYDPKHEEPQNFQDPSSTPRCGEATRLRGGIFFHHSLAAQNCVAILQMTIKGWENDQHLELGAPYFQTNPDNVHEMTQINRITFLLILTFIDKKWSISTQQTGLTKPLRGSNADSPNATETKSSRVKNVQNVIPLTKSIAAKMKLFCFKNSDVWIYNFCLSGVMIVVFIVCTFPWNICVFQTFRQNLRCATIKSTLVWRTIQCPIDA